MLHKTSNSLRSGADYYGNEAESAAARALDTTRQFAGQAIERAGEKVRGLGVGVKDLASRGASTMSEATSAAQQRLRDYSQATVRYVSDEPVKAALIAAAVGALVAGLIIALRRRDSDY
jgi:ElaB/YqjD/DUF883 family membrane-anchored ribosome-binding protein